MVELRLPARAGSFYAGSEKALREQIGECFTHRYGPRELPEVREEGARRLTALISPHAGYMFSGPIAAKGYHHMAQDGRPGAMILVGPNHTGYGSGVSIMTDGVWRTPLGEVEIDSDLAQRVQSLSEYIDIDDAAHLYEHSIEVQLPFLQYLYGRFPFVPVCMMMQDLEVSRDLGEAIAEASEGRDVAIIASTDLSHYEPQSVAKEKDKLVLEAIRDLNEERLQSIVASRGISMCGYGPVSAALVASKRMGVKRGIILQYKTSGDITGDKSSVVGYASVAIVK